MIYNDNMDINEIAGLAEYQWSIKEHLGYIKDQ